jgi:hypothetical protein
MYSVSKFARPASALIAVSLACLAVPAFAAEADGKTATQASAAMAASASAPEKRYCVIEAQTDSRVPLKTCRTKAEWAADGIDVSKKK